MTTMEWVLPAIFIAATVVATAGVAWMRMPTMGAAVRRMPPPLMRPDHPEADWIQAAVPRSALVIVYEDAHGTPTEQVVHPKTIRGQRIGNGRVRPTVVNVFCERDRAMRALRIDRILSAADLRTGEFVDDLHTYFGSAQPGGAPARTYPAA